MDPAAIALLVRERLPALLEWLRTAVDADSPTEDKGLADLVGDMVQAKAESLGMRCSLDRQSRFGDNRICRLVSPDAAGKVLLIGHYDTIFPAGTAAARPFRISGGRAYGPGTYDMKAGLAVGLFAIEALQRTRAPLPVSITFLANSDEEHGSPASREVIAEEARRHDLVIILEGCAPDEAIITERKGVGKFTLGVNGREAHAGLQPEKGVNSIVEMAHRIVAVHALADPAAGTTLEPSTIRGGTNPFVVPELTELTIDCRAASLAELDRVVAGLQEIAAAPPAIRGATVTLGGGFHRPPMVAGPTVREHVTRLRAIAAALGQDLTLAASGGASDGNLTAAAGIPTIDGFGPAGDFAHSPDEYIELASLERRCALLACFLADFASRSSDAGDQAPVDTHH